MRIEARLATGVIVRNLEGGGVVAFSRFRFRASRLTGDSTSTKTTALIQLMAVGRAGEVLSGAVRGQMVLAEGLMTSTTPKGRPGRIWTVPKLVARYVELGPIPRGTIKPDLGLPEGVEIAAAELVDEDAEADEI